MPKILVCMLFVGMLMFASCTQADHQPASPASTAKSGDPTASPADKSTWVEVTFDGLMIFEKLDNGQYEVGILPRSASLDHYFQIIVDGKAIALPNQTTANPVWTLDVVPPPSGTPRAQDIIAREKKQCNRVADTTAFEDLEHMNDFCWIMDLEKDLNPNKPLALRQDGLVPIILLKNGELYTKTKYDEQERQDANKKWVDYGFVAETIALRIKLQEGESLQLNVPGLKPLFTLDKNITSAALLNAPVPITGATPTPMPPGTKSHFQRYYDAFSNVVSGQEYDIRNKKNGLHPINRLYPPGMEDRASSIDSVSLVDKIRSKFTIPHAACGIVRLGTRTKSLSQAGAPQ